MHRTRIARLVAAIYIASLFSASPQAVEARDPKADSSGSGIQELSLSSQTITSAGPLTAIQATSDLNCAVNHASDSSGEFYGDTACATLVATSGVLYGPDYIPAGDVAEVVYTFIDQSPVTGNGTVGDPYRITTSVGLGDTNLTITQTDTYVVGREWYQTDVAITNNDTGPRTGVLYRAGDCYLQDSDWGFGQVDSSTGAVACVEAEQDAGGNEVKGDRVEEWLPLTPGSRYMEAHYSEIWSHIATKTPFPNTVRANDFIDNGAGLSWSFEVGPAETHTFSHTTTFSPVLASTQECASEQLADVAPVVPSGGRVEVAYDARFIVPENLDPDGAMALQVAEAIRDRADLTLDRYDALGFNTPPSLTIEIVCDPFPVLPILTDLIPPGVPAFVEAQDKVKFQAQYVANQFHDIVADGFAGDWNLPPRHWVSTVDHEMFHTVQYRMRLFQEIFWADLALGNDTVYESTAVLAQDLLADADDEPQGGEGGQYLDHVDAFMSDPPTIDGGLLHSRRYDAAGVFQYWGERFGDASAASLEQRVAGFMREMLNPLTVRTGAMQNAIGRNVFGFPEYDVYDALRDFYVAGASLTASNVTTAVNSQYQILDHEVPYGAAAPDPVVVPNYASLHTEPLDLADGPVDERLRVEHADGQAFEVSIPADVDRIEVQVSTSAVGGQHSNVRLAVLPRRSGGITDLSSGLLTVGPDEGDTWREVVTTGDAPRVTIIIVGSQHAVDYRLQVREVGDPARVDITSASTDASARVTATAFLGHGTTLDTTVTAGQVTAQIGSAPAIVERVERVGGAYRVYVRPNGTLEGTHDLTITFDGAADTLPGGVQVPAPEPAPAPSTSESAASGSFGQLAQGQTASLEASLAGGAAADFSIAWEGSDFDLVLTSPSGRVIDEDTTAADVEVTTTATSTTIRVITPERGTWTMEAVGVDVPGPEPVTYEALEEYPELRSDLALESSNAAGTPIGAVFGWSTPDDPAMAQLVTATIRDPQGVSRQFPLLDEGPEGAAAAGDGVYAAQLWGTSLPGEYQVTVEAIGVADDGSRISRIETASVTLGAMTDVDGDGIADAVEPGFGLDPANAADGASDLDGDGVSFADELAAGSDPRLEDTDGGGESDGSELARASSPRMPGDDASIPDVLLAAIPRDGRAMEVSVATATGTAQVEVFRHGNGSVVSLGTHPGSGVTFVDGPLAAGSYTYVARAVVGSARGPAQAVGPLPTLDDAVPPTARILVNGGSWSTSEPEVTVEFLDVSEPVTSMRLGLSEGALAEAPWVPFQALTTFTLPSQNGDYTILAQVRDASGLGSSAAAARIRLEHRDTVAPSSIVTAVLIARPVDGGPPYPDGAVVYEATDDDSGVASVELWARHRPTESSEWGAWEQAASTTESPATFTFAADGWYDFYTVAIDVAGNREAPPASADASAVFDSQAPVSQAGPLASSYTATSVAVPYQATDGLSGVVSVELWARHRPSGSSTWTAWALAATGTSSPITYQFSGDGNYEFYTIAVDAAGNREPAPATADAATTRDATDDPPTLSGYFYGYQTSWGCGKFSCIGWQITGSGTATDDTSNVSVQYRMYKVSSTGSMTLVFDWKSAIPTDGAFNELSEGYRTSDRIQGVSTSTSGFRIYVRAVAGGKTTIRTFFVSTQSCEYC